MDMFARKILLQLAAIATLGSMGATALADYDCFEEVDTAPEPIPAKFCPASGPALVRLNVTSGGGTSWRLTVTDVRPPTLVNVWVTAFLFDDDDHEFPACHIHPSETLNRTKPSTTSVRNCNTSGLPRPAYATIFAAEE
jgi:hypothetical protein